MIPPLENSKTVIGILSIIIGVDWTCLTLAFSPVFSTSPNYIIGVSPASPVSLSNCIGSTSSCDCFPNSIPRQLKRSYTADQLCDPSLAITRNAGDSIAISYRNLSKIRPQNKC
jgi:hypothetical protein